MPGRSPRRADSAMRIVLFHAISGVPWWKIGGEILLTTKSAKDTKEEKGIETDRVMVFQSAA